MTEYIKLSNLAEVIMGQSPKSSTYNKDGVGLPFFQGKAEFGDRNPTIKKWCSKPLRIAEPNDILLSVRAPVGPTNVCNSKSCIGRGLTAIRSRKKTDYLFLWYYLRSIEKHLAHKGVGSTFAAIGRDQIKNIQVPKMDYKSQRHVAFILDKCESVRAKRKEANSLVDEFIKSVFFDMFGDPMKEKKDIKTLSEVCEINPSLDVKLSKNTEVSFIPMSAVSKKGDVDISQTRRYEDVKNGFTYFKNEDVLFAKITPCMENGKGAIARNLTNGIGFGSTEFHVLRPNGKDVNSEWIYFLLSLDHIRQIAARNMTGTAGQKRVPVSFLKTLNLSIPPLADQEKFANIVQKVEKLKERQRKSEEELNNLFNSLMQRAFKGELVQ